MMTTLYLVRAKHPTVPGEPTSIHFTRAAADAKATELTLAIVADCIAPDPGATDLFLPLRSGGIWQHVLENAQLARIGAIAGMTTDEVREHGCLSGDLAGYLADDSGADVWIEEIEADMPLPRVFVKQDHGAMRRIIVDRGFVDLMILDQDATLCPAMGDVGDQPQVSVAFDRYWHPTPAPETPNAG